MKFHLWTAGIIIAFASTTTLAQENPGLIFDMDSVQHKPTEITGKDKQKHPAGSAELVDGKFAKAVKFSFVEGASGGFMTGPVRPTPQWDQCDGLSFWVKGDGSRSWGGIELIDKSNFKLRYGYCFPIESAEWTKITVPWGDFVPELAGPLVDAKTGFKPSDFGNFWFGKWHYWREYPAHSYAIDQVALETKIQQPAIAAPDTGLKRFCAKLARKKPVTIVTMGDSLTDTRHWANKKNPWPEQLARGIEAKFGSKVTIVNPAMGGTTLSQNVIVMTKWAVEAPSPDLVTVWFGFNDWDSGVRGERFGQYLNMAVQRIRRQTGGSADILLLTTCPAHARWETGKELEEAAKQAAADTKAAVVDIAAEFRKAGNADEALKRKYWEWDKVHLGPAGHELVSATVLRAINEEPKR